jgi:ankyrin repeat protein
VLPEVIKDFQFIVQLLQNKANINGVNEHGNTPLHYACFWNYDQVAEVIKDSTIRSINKEC